MEFKIEKGIPNVRSVTRGKWNRVLEALGALGYDEHMSVDCEDGELPIALRARLWSAMQKRKISKAFRTSSGINCVKIWKRQEAERNE